MKIVKVDHRNKWVYANEQTEKNVPFVKNEDTENIVVK